MPRRWPLETGSCITTNSCRMQLPRPAPNYEDRTTGFGHDRQMTTENNTEQNSLVFKPRPRASLVLTPTERNRRIFKSSGCCPVNGSCSRRVPQYSATPGVLSGKCMGQPKNEQRLPRNFPLRSPEQLLILPTLGVSVWHCAALEEPIEADNTAPVPVHSEKGPEMLFGSRKRCPPGALGSSTL